MNCIESHSTVYTIQSQLWDSVFFWDHQRGARSELISGPQATSKNSTYHQRAENVINKNIKFKANRTTLLLQK